MAKPEDQFGVVDFIHGLQFSIVPDDAIAFAKRGLTDTLGVAVAGSTTHLSNIISNHAARHFGVGDGNSCRLWFDGRVVSPVGAALAHGMMIDSLDAHDGYKPAKGHVACGLIPALLAMVEATGQTNGEEFITALTIGYEIGSRAGAALHGTVPDYHTSGAWVSLAAAAVAARYLNLDPEQTRHALGIAEYHGPRSQMMRVIDHPTMLKDGSGFGAMAGISAAYLAQDGFTGAPSITTERDDAAPFWQNLGVRWLVKEQYIKLYPVCRWAQPPVVAALALKEKHGFEPDQIDAIEISTFHEAACLATYHPTSSSEAQYSLPYPVGVALAHGKIAAEHVHEDGLANQDVENLCNRMTMVEVEAYNDAFPARRFAHVSIRLKDGREFTSDRTEAIGDPENPVSDQIVEEKFLQLTQPVLGNENASRLLHLTHEAEHTETVQALLAALHTPPEP